MVRQMTSGNPTPVPWAGKFEEIGLKILVVKREA